MPVPSSSSSVRVATLVTVAPLLLAHDAFSDVHVRTEHAHGRRLPGGRCGRAPVGRGGTPSGAGRAGSPPVVRKPARELGEVAEHDVRPGRAQLLGVARPGGHRDRQRARRCARRARRRCGRRRRRSRRARAAPPPSARPTGCRSPRPASMPRCSRCSLALGSYLAVTTIARPPAARTARDRLAGAGHRGRGGDGDTPGTSTRYRSAIGRHPVRREPVDHLLRQRRPEPRDRQVGVDVRPRPLGQRQVAGADAGPGVDEGHVEVEADGQGGGSHGGSRGGSRGGHMGHCAQALRRAVGGPV